MNPATDAPGAALDTALDVALDAALGASLGASLDGAAELRASLGEALEKACDRIAPAWPLDRLIAVNPWWGFVDQPFGHAAGSLAALQGARLVMSRAWYRQQWQAGRFTEEDLRDAAAELGGLEELPELLRALDEREPRPARRAAVVDLVDQDRLEERGLRWRDVVLTSISQLCASWFDDGQASLPPERGGGLYALWRRVAEQDKSPTLLMGLSTWPALVRELPRDPEALCARALADLGLDDEEVEGYATQLLLDVVGWASACAYRRFVARLAGSDDGQLRELLAIRLAWEWLLWRAGEPALAARWRSARRAWPRLEAQARESRGPDLVFARALEIAYQRSMVEGLRASSAATPTTTATQPLVQAAFCIDVRSEVYRRALEGVSREVQTLGFAGFFGLPVEFEPLGAPAARPQLPGPLAPRLRVLQRGGPPGVIARRHARLEAHAAFRRFKTSPVSGFSFVETLGLLSAGKLVLDLFGKRAAAPVDHAGLHSREARALKPRIEGTTAGESLSIEDRIALAAGLLRAMSFTRGFARLVLLLGHGSETRNNPLAAGLDCGACCGQTGEVNARAAAALLNDEGVRAGLGSLGIEIPATTHFLPGLHNTTTDEVELFDLDEVPPGHQPDVERARSWLHAASARARLERAPRLGLAGTSGRSLEKALKARARDPSEVRPEWGLVNNAAFLATRRERHRHLDLEGRAFLHEYRCEEDEGHAVLELIMTAPLVVAHWINAQYYASTVDPVRYGSGNKLLHNVVGGHVGVFEGNGGDLRIGLAHQSLHDGERLLHEPLRLTAVLEAPREAIDAVLSKHEGVRQLVENGWIHLLQLEPGGDGIAARRASGWVAI